MLWWVLLCDYCSFCHLPKTSGRGRAINAHIIIADYHSDHCPLFRVCSFVELSSSFIITTPEGAAVVYINTFVILLQSYITRAWGMPASFVHSCILVHTRLSEDQDTDSFFLQWIVSKGPTIAFLYNHSLSRRNIDGFRLYVCS